MKKRILLIASVFVCAVSLAQRRPPVFDRLLYAEPILIDSLHCMVDSMVHCINNAGICEPDSNEVFFYDTKGNLVCGGVGCAYRFVYEYDTNGNMISYTKLNSYGSWIEQNLYSDFTAYGDPVYLMNITFGNNNVADTTKWKYSYTYNANGQIVGNRIWWDTAVSVTDDPGWIYAITLNFSYTESGNLDTMLDTFAFTEEYILPNYRHIYTYNENGYAVTELQQSVGNIYNLAHGIDSVAVWVTTDYIVHYYYPRTDGECASSGISALQKDAVKIYPNPFTDKLTIEPNISYRLFDLLGSEMDKNNLGALPVGTYILSTEKGSVRVVKGEE